MFVHLFERRIRIIDKPDVILNPCIYDEIEKEEII